MVHIETVDLASRNVVFPNDRVGMVIAQPHLTLSTVEPFRCVPEAKADQLAVIARTLDVSRERHHGAQKTHFTIFPEYSIPGPEGIKMIQDALGQANWPTGTVIIGGTDGLSKQQFAVLSAELNTHLDKVHNNINRVAAHEWINCKITWVKGADGTVERWLQPKIAPAWQEANFAFQQMFQGNSVYTFKGRLANNTPYQFCTLVCFDWIAVIDNKRVWQWVLEHLNNQAIQNGGGQFPISWFFVVQRNPKPSHNSFLAEVTNFFDQTTLPNIRRDRTCLLFANGAGRPDFGKANEFGQTSLIFPQQLVFEDPTCGPSYSNGGMRFRGSPLLHGYHDVYFREKGACIHSFSQINPDSRPAPPAGRTTAVLNASVFPFNGTVDRRAPSAPVAAATKWWNDELDSLPKLSTNYQGLPLVPQLDANHDLNVHALRGVFDHAAMVAIRLAAQQSKTINVDEWGTEETQALEHLVNTLNIISLGSTVPTMSSIPPHATVNLRGHLVDIVAIQGSTHEQCLTHCGKIVPKPGRQMLIVSRDPDNNRWSKKFGSILKSRSAGLGEERNITDPSDGMLHIGYRNLLETIQNHNTVNDLHGAIDAELAA